MTPPGSGLRVGIIGSGFMGAVHTRAAVDSGATVVAIASSSRDRAEAAATRFGIPRALEVDDLLADPAIDVVHVCTPNATHAPITRTAITAGKHVICEKPLGVTAAEAGELERFAAEAGVVATVPFVYRFHPMVREARARIASGDPGPLTTISGSYLQDWLLDAPADVWRRSPDAAGPSRTFADIGSHLGDLVEFVTGDRIARLVARIGGPDADHFATVLIELSSGALGTFLVSQVAPGRKNALVVEIAGTAESVRFEQERPDELWVGRRRGTELVARDPGTNVADSARLSAIPAGHPIGYPDAFAAFVADSYAAVRGDAPDGLPTFRDGVRAAQVTEAVLASAAGRTWTELP